MPCCGSQVSLRRSKRGTQFFAHKVLGACATAPETEAHLRIKQIAVEVARSYGWEAETEVSGIGDDGAPWRADVLAWRNEKKIAIEVQWSSQTDEETLRRQERYRRSHVRGLWLIRQKGFPVSLSLPAAQLVEANGEYWAMLPQGYGSHQRASVRGFLEAAFDRRLRFGFPVGTPASASIRVGQMTCWGDSCGAETKLIAGIDVQVGPNTTTLTIPDFDSFPDLMQQVSAHIPDGLGIGSIKKRYSRTQERSYLSNGCVMCDRLIGQFFEHDTRDDTEVVAQFTFELSERWREAVAGDGGMSEHWWVSGE